MSIYRSVIELEEKGEAGALAMIIDSQGSTPRHTGSKMLVYENGSFIGTVGGGEIENRVISEARQSMVDGRSRVLHYNMSDPKHGDPGICGGQV
jgi:xanthine dehydrogenase accessory factor